MSLLVGAPANPQADTGPTVCSCFGVGRNVIVKGIREGLNTVEALGQSLKCGTNCGSCVPELKALLATARAGVIDEDLRPPALAHGASAAA